jgi:ribose/xylose/arabinose/galactoside ABC-type transport system permease subunit
MLQSKRHSRNASRLPGQQGGRRFVRLRDALRRFLARKRRAYVVPTALFLAFFLVYAIPTDLGWIEVFLLVFRHALPFIFISLGAGLVLSAGYVDLSSSGMATLTGFVFVWATYSWFGHTTGFPATAGLILSAAVALTLSSGLSALMAYGLVSRRAPPLLLTWAAGALLFLVPLPLLPLLPADLLASSSSVPATFLTQMGMDPRTTWYSPHGWFGGFGILAVTAVITLAAILLVVGFTNIDRRACAIGANDLSAFYAGVSRQRTVVIVYTIAGILSGLAGISYVVLNQSAPLAVMRGWELFGIAIAVLAGTSMSGGFLYLRPIIVSALAFQAIQFVTANLFKSKISQDAVCDGASQMSQFLCAIQPHMEVVVYSLFYVVFMIVVLLFGPALIPNIGVVLKNYEQDMPR